MEVAALSRNALETTIDRLSALSLVDVLASEDRYALHPLTRNFVRDELLADAQIARETGMRFAEYWVAYAKRYGGRSENYKTFNHLEAEWINLDAAAEWLWQTATVQDEDVGDKDAARKLNGLANALHQFLSFGGRWEENVRLNMRAYEAMSALNEWSEAGWRAYRVAWTYQVRANINETMRWTDRCTKAWAQGGSKYNQAVGIRMRGLLAREQNDYDTSEQLFQDALVIWRELKNDEWTVIVLNDLGALERRREQYDRANQYYREALALAEKQSSKENQANISVNLGLLALYREYWAEAREWYEKALPLSREIGRQDSIASALYGHARVHEAEGHPDLALPPAQEALTIYERLQHGNEAETRELVERLKKKVGGE